MAFLWTTLCVVVMVTAAMSKPVCLSEDEDSSKSSESRDSGSSEETDTHIRDSQDPLQPAFTETDRPNAKEQTDPLNTAALLPSADSGLFPATLNTSALPDPEDPQTSTDIDALQLMPEDPSQTALGMDISQDMPGTDPAQNSMNTDTVHVLPETAVSLHPGKTETDIIISVGGTAQPQVITTTTTSTTYQGFPRGATPPFPPHIIKPTLPPFSGTPPLPIPIVTSLTASPGSFILQFMTPEPDPPRGDSK
ncbi:mucin-2-like [Seriola aureovittata]|uniref:mucin-2-like n=1 Tax=Seriola aureovittata TaxID=2871759 RepID=UPI0024BE7042|nr:mucin-2-like [Seriola aureovittata]